MVIATQNPSVGYDGTYRLPPAQLDRFLARVSLGYPTNAQEIALLREPPARRRCQRAGTLRELLAAQAPVEEVRASERAAGLRRRRARGHAPPPAERDRRQPARGPAAARRRPGARGAAGPRLRAARRRPGARGRRCSRTASSPSPPRPPRRSSRSSRTPARRAGAVIRRGALAARPGAARVAAAALGSLALFALALGADRALCRQRRRARRWRRGGSTVTRTLDRREVQEGQPITLHFDGRRPARAAGAGRGAGRRRRLARRSRTTGRVTLRHRPPGRARPGARRRCGCATTSACSRARPRRARRSRVLVLPAPAPPERLRARRRRGRRRPRARRAAPVHAGHADEPRPLGRARRAAASCRSATS